MNSNVTSGGGGSSRGINRVSNGSWSVAVGAAAAAEVLTASTATTASTYRRRQRRDKQDKVEPTSLYLDIPKSKQ
jgi:hypothetical protein